MIDERTEQLINRRLDGELNDAESLELDRLLIRSPQARALLEDYQRIDNLAGESLQLALQDTSHDASYSPEMMEGMAHVRRGHRWNVAMVLAIAAMIAMVVAGVPSKWWPPRALDPQLADQPAPATVTTDDLAYVHAPVEGIYGTRNQNQHITRNLIGVMDEEGEGIYFLEVQRKDTTVTPVSFNY